MRDNPGGTSGTSSKDRFSYVPSPSIEQQPVSVTVMAPGEASLTVKEGAVPAYCSAASLQWQVSTNKGSSASKVPPAPFTNSRDAGVAVLGRCYVQRVPKTRAVAQHGRLG